MPHYDYRCRDCSFVFEATHPFNAPMPLCPDCESTQVERFLKQAPAHHDYITAHPGDGKRATADQLREKWREETPKLRKKLRDKLGEEAVQTLPNLNMDNDA